MVGLLGSNLDDQPEPINSMERKIVSVTLLLKQ